MEPEEMPNFPNWAKYICLVNNGYREVSDILKHVDVTKNTVKRRMYELNEKDLVQPKNEINTRYTGYTYELTEFGRKIADAIESQRE